MTKPKAYICTMKCSDPERIADITAAVYKAGYFPVFPPLLTAPFINDAEPEEQKDALEFAREQIRFSKILIVCEKRRDDSMKVEIAAARYYRVPVSTLEGVLDVREHGREKRDT